MNDKKILEELLYIDKNYFGSKKNKDYLYLNHFFQINSKNSNEIVYSLYKNSKNILLNSNEILLKFKNLLIILEKNLYFLSINFQNFNIIKNEKDLSLSLICFFIYKSFTTHDPLKYKQNEMEEKENVFLELANDSDSIINSVVSLLEKMLIWIKIKVQKSYLIQKQETRLALIWFLLEMTKSKNSILYCEKPIYPNKGMYFYIKEEYEINFNIELSHIAYEYSNIWNNRLYLYSYHYTTVNEILRPNPRSNKIIEKSNSLLDSLNNILTNYVYISNERLDSMIIDLCKEYSIVEANIYEDYKLFIEQYIKYTRKGEKDWIKSLSKTLSIYLRIINLINIRDNNKNEKIYLPPMFCFRGRTYFLSSYSITFQKELRYCCNWGKYENIDLFLTHPLLECIENELEKRHFLLKNISIFNFLNKKNKIKNAVIWIIVSIAETNKSKKPSWTLDDFISEGISIIENWEMLKNITDLEDKIKIKYLINILKEIEKDIYIKWLISKDATASVFQHSIKSMGVKNEESLKWCNFQSKDTWYDTYNFIISTWKKEYLGTIYKYDESVDKYFTRKTLKDTIMTHTYGALKNTSLERFLKKIKEVFKEDTIDIFLEKKLIHFFKDFFNFLETKSSIIADSTKIMKKLLKDIPKEEITFSDETKIYLTYYKKTTVQIEGKIKGKRITRQEIRLLNEKDLRKLSSSIRANYVQALDGSLVRWFYAMGYKGITIHDCFMVDYMSISFLIAVINQGMRINFHKLNTNINFKEQSIFSLFIIL